MTLSLTALREHINRQELALSDQSRQLATAIKERDEAREAAGIGKWADDVRLAAKFAKERDEAIVERDQAIAHDRQPYPTADAYEKACAALHKHRARADQAEQRLANIGEAWLTIERDTAESIATWLDRRAARLDGYTEQQAETETIAEELRAGSWREKAGE